MTTYSSILQAAMKLSPRERTELVDALLETIKDEPGGFPSAELRAEIARRSEAYKRGELVGIPWEQVREEADNAVPKLSGEWRREIARRSAEIDAGTATYVRWEQVQDRARRAAEHPE